MKDTANLLKGALQEAPWCRLFAALCLLALTVGCDGAPLSLLEDQQDPLSLSQSGRQRMSLGDFRATFQRDPTPENLRAVQEATQARSLQRLDESRASRGSTSIEPKQSNAWVPEPLPEWEAGTTEWTYSWTSSEGQDLLNAYWDGITYDVDTGFEADESRSTYIPLYVPGTGNILDVDIELTFLEHYWTPDLNISLTRPLLPPAVPDTTTLTSGTPYVFYSPPLVDFLPEHFDSTYFDDEADWHIQEWDKGPTSPFKGHFRPYGSYIWIDETWGGTSDEPLALLDGPTLPGDWDLIVEDFISWGTLFTYAPDYIYYPEDYASEGVLYDWKLVLTFQGLPLPNAVVGQPYTASATGIDPTDAAYSWSLVSGGDGLPNGLPGGFSGGVFDFTPDAPGTWTFTIQGAQASPATATLSDPPAGPVTLVTPTVAATAQVTISVYPELVLLPAALPNGKVGVPYTETSFAALGGAGPGSYTWSAEGLPDGLALGPTSGTISGTPQEAGDHVVIVTVTSSDGQSVSLPIPLHVDYADLEITAPSPLTGWVAGIEHSQTLAATGGNGSYLWALPPGSSLPATLSLSPVGIISGTPQTEGTYGVEIQVASGDGQGPVSKVFEIIVTDPNDPLGIVTSSLPNGKELPDGTRGVSYATTLVAQGADGNYSWSLAPGSSLPTTLTLSSAGVIEGAPDSAGLYEFTVQLQAGYGDPVTADLSIEVFNPALEISTTNADLPEGQLVGLEYPATPLEAGGGDGANYTWEIVDPLAFPPGLVLDSGVISGVATAQGSFTFEVAVTSGEGDYSQTVSETYTLELDFPTLEIVTNALPGGFTGRPYELALQAKGGDSNYSWSLTWGDLPPGLTLTNGVISGTPTTPGLYPLALTVSSKGQVAVSHSEDANGGWSISIVLGDPQTVADCDPGSFDNYYRFQTQAQCLRFLDSGGTMDSRKGEFPTVSITTELLPAGRKDNAYVATFAAEGGADNPDSFYRWYSDDLPDWLTLEAETGAILGTPRAGGTYTFTVTVKSDGRDDLSDSKVFSIEVSEFSDPETVKDCKKGGWRDYGFRNQGQCIRFVRTGIDSRTGEFPVLSITTESLPDGELGKRYNHTLQATGGSDHRSDKYTWSSLDLPGWLSLNPNSGKLRGRPSQAGTYTFAVTVTSADGQTDSKEFSLLIEGDDNEGCSDLTISTRSLPDARKDKRYSKKLRTRGCPHNYHGDLTWSSPDLPVWLNLNSESGKLFGTPWETGTFTFTAMVADDSGNSATKTLSLTVKKR